MSFIARYHGDCGQCGHDLADEQVDYAQDETLLHTSCLKDYESGVTPEVKLGRQEKRCDSCFTIHAGECP